MKLRNVTLILGFFLVGCLEKDISEEKMKTVPYVDIKKFMGDWYVIANIPTFLEKNATNAIESYRLNSKNEIETTFSFYKNSQMVKRKNFIQKALLSILKRMQSGKCNFYGLSK